MSWAVYRLSYWERPRVDPVADGLDIRGREGSARLRHAAPGGDREVQRADRWLADGDGFNRICVIGERVAHAMVPRGKLTPHLGWKTLVLI